MSSNGRRDLTDSSEFFEFFKIDLFHAEIFVFTPKGDLISLPKGATVLDFAFAVHSALGLHCLGAKVDGKIQPINWELKSGSTIEILHTAAKKPSLDWLREVKTPKARSSIRRWLKTTGRQESIELGKDIIQAAFRRLRIATPFADTIAPLLHHLGVGNLDRLYEQVGNGEIPANRVTGYFPDSSCAPESRSGAGCFPHCRHLCRPYPSPGSGGRHGQPHGAVREVLQSDSRRSNRRFCHARPRHLGPSRRLQQCAALCPRTGNGRSTSPGTRENRKPTWSRSK